MKLPVSSFKVLRMIILGYLHQGGADRRPASLKAVESATGVGSTKISGNNGSLADLGIIEKDGNAGYRLTDRGLEVARALEFEERELTKRALGSLLQENEVISQALNVLRVRGGLDSEAFAKHLMMASGESKATPAAQTGARALIDILMEAGLVEQDGDTYTATSARSGAQSSLPTSEADDFGASEPAVAEPSESIRREVVRIHDGDPHSVTVKIEVSLTGDDLADPVRAKAIIAGIRGLAELESD